MSGARDELDTVYSVTVRRENGDERLLSLCRTEEEFRDFTVLELKSRVTQAFNGVAGSICLIFADKHLNDEHTLSFYGIKHQDTVHVTWEMPAQALLRKCLKKSKSKRCKAPVESEEGGWNNKDKGKRRSMENLLNL